VETRSCNYCSREKTGSITHIERVFVASGIQQAMRMCHNDIFGLPGTTIFFSHYLTNGTSLEKKIIGPKSVF
jgi:hypothetical protein